MKTFRNYPLESTDGVLLHLGISEGVYVGTEVLHNHPALEVNLILEGTCDYVIGDQTYRCEKGDIVLIGEDQTHRAWNADSAVFLVLLFHHDLFGSADTSGYFQRLMAPFWGLGKQFPHVFPAAAPGQDRLRALLLAMDAEQLSADLGYRFMLKAQTQEFCVLLGRCFGIDDKSPLLENGLKRKRFQPVIEYVAAHYADRILVEDLAALVFMSPANFNRVFRSAMGQSPLEYVIQQRIREASTQLASSDRKIIDVAADCGFPTVSHFIGSFRKYTGQTPSEYRQKRQD